jgi:hypothetical protein
VEGRFRLVHEFAHIVQRQMAGSAAERRAALRDEDEYEEDADAAAEVVAQGGRPQVRPAVFQLAADRGKKKKAKKTTTDQDEQSSSSVPARGRCDVAWNGQTFILTFNAADIAEVENPAHYAFRIYLNRAFTGLSDQVTSVALQKFSGVCIEKDDGECSSSQEVRERAKQLGTKSYGFIITIRLHRKVTDWLAENYPETHPIDIALGEKSASGPAESSHDPKKDGASKSGRNTTEQDTTKTGADVNFSNGGYPGDQGTDRAGMPRFVPKAHLQLKPNLMQQVDGAKVELAVVFEEAGGPYNLLMNVFPGRAHFDWSVYQVGPDGKQHQVDNGPWIETGAREYDVRLGKCNRCIIEVLITSESFRPGYSLLLQTAPIEVVSEQARSSQVFNEALVGEGDDKQFTRGPDGSLQVKPGKKPHDPKESIDTYDREIGAIDELVKQGKLSLDQASRAKELRQQAKEQLQKIEQDRQGQATYLVCGTFVSREDGQHLPLSLYMHRTRRSIERGGWYRYEVVLTDATLDPTNPEKHPGQLGSSLGDVMEGIRDSSSPALAEQVALKHMADHWHAHNSYPSGTVQLAVELKEQPGQVREYSIDTGNWRKPLKKALAYGSMGLGVLALAATPFTGGGSTAVGVLMISSAVTGLAGMALDIEDRIAKGTFKADTQLLLDIAGLVGTLLGLGALSQTLRGARLVAQTRYLLVLGTTDVAQGVLFTAEIRKQLLDIDAEYEVKLATASTEEEKARIRSERDSHINQLLGAAAINGGLMLVSLAGTAKQIKHINALRSMKLRPEVESLLSTKNIEQLEKVLQAHHDGTAPLNEHELHNVEKRLEELRQPPGTTTGKSSTGGQSSDHEAWRKAQSAEELMELIGSDYKNSPVRVHYEAEVRALGAEGEQIIREAAGDRTKLEQGARMISAKRLEISSKFKDQTPEPLLDYIFELNLERYDTKWGPTFDWMWNQYGDYEKIIRKAATPNKDINFFLSGFDSWCLKNGHKYIHPK